MPPIRLPPPGSSQRTKKQKPRVSRTRVRLGRGHHVPLHRLLEGGSPEARGRPPSPGSSRRARDTASRRPPHALRGRARRRAGVGPPAVALAPRGRPPRPSLVSGPRPGRIRSLTTLQPQRCAPARPAPRADGLAVSGAHAWRWWPATNPQCPVEPPGPEKKNKKKTRNLNLKRGAAVSPWPPSARPRVPNSPLPYGELRGAQCLLPRSDSRPGGGLTGWSARGLLVQPCQTPFVSELWPFQRKNQKNFDNS